MALSLFTVLTLFTVDTIDAQSSTSTTASTLGSIKIAGNVAMYEKGYLTFTTIPPRSTPNENSLTFYPNGATQLTASGKVTVVSTAEGSTWTVGAGGGVDVLATGEGSKIIVNAGTYVYVYSTGVDSSLTIDAGTFMTMYSTGDRSEVTGTYGNTIYVEHDGIGKDATLNLKKIVLVMKRVLSENIGNVQESSSATITHRMVICLLPLLLLV